MSTFVIATGTIDSEIDSRQVGDDHKLKTSFRINTDPGWYTVVCWGDLGQKVPAQGSFVIVTGRLSGRSYQVDGEASKRSVVEINASNIEVPGQAAAPRPGARPASGPASVVNDSSMFDD